MRDKLRKRKIRNAIIIASIFFVFFEVLSILRSNYGQKNNAANQKESFVEINVNGAKPVKKPLPEKWKACEGDDSLRALKNFDDSNWKVVSPVLDLEKNEINFKGICWFRCYFKIDSSLLNKVFGLKIQHLGASEFYLDGKYLDGFGTVSHLPDSEETYRPSTAILISLPDTLDHTMAVRYSNHSYLKNREKYQEKNAGITISFLPDGNFFYRETAAIDDLLFYFTILFGFFITLSSVHLLIYLFYRKHIQNLFYSLFVFIFSLLALMPYLYIKITNPQALLSFEHNVILIVILFFLSIVACLHSLFKPKLWKRMFLIQAILCLAIIFIHYSNVLTVIKGNLLLSLVLFAIIESVRTVILGIKKKYPGAGIIGTGVLVFFLFISILFIDAFITENISFNQDTSIYMITLAIISIISIPLSMSIYLARNFALTNNNLSLKLEEVEELSAKSLAQEKEKQFLLENQNITLEKQVTERTFEITAQKKIIEEKNKDIIDSINYARRIQSAMLPEESYFKSVFKNSFILYQPRDIVSGDFYYATELNNHKLIIAADCTGHGVPGALMSMVGSNIINKLTHENSIVDPKILLESLHTQLRHALKQDQKGSANRDGMDVAAVLITTTEVIYAGANRPLIYFDKDSQLQEIKATKTPIGGSHIDNVTIEQHNLPIEKIKQFYLFSDGFADQFGGPDGKKLMVSKFKIWLGQIISMSVEEQHRFLLNEFLKWKQDTEQVDDVMVIGVKI